jgi:hypothetical protein
VLVRRYSGDHPHHYGSYVSAVMESMARRIAGRTGMPRKGMAAGAEE